MKKKFLEFHTSTTTVHKQLRAVELPALVLAEIKFEPEWLEPRGPHILVDFCLCSAALTAVQPFITSIY